LRAVRCVEFNHSRVGDAFTAAMVELAEPSRASRGQAADHPPGVPGVAEGRSLART
jgi:hypothetical protein